MSDDDDHHDERIGEKRPAGRPSKQKAARRGPSGRQQENVDALQRDIEKLRSRVEALEAFSANVVGDLPMIYRSMTTTQLIDVILTTKQQMTAIQQRIATRDDYREFSRRRELTLRELALKLDDSDGSELLKFLQAKLAANPRNGQPYHLDAYDDGSKFHGRHAFVKFVQDTFDALNPTARQDTLALVFFTASGCGKTRALLQLKSTLNMPSSSSSAATATPPTRVIYIGYNCNSTLDEGNELELMQSTTFLPRVICRRVLAALLGPDEMSAVGGLMVAQMKGLLDDAPLPPLTTLHEKIRQYLQDNCITRLVVAVDELQMLTPVHDGETQETFKGARIVMRVLRELQWVLFNACGIKMLPIGTGIRAHTALESDDTLGKVQFVSGNGNTDDDSILLSREDFAALWKSYYPTMTFDPLTVASYWPRVRTMFDRRMPSMGDPKPFDEIIIDTWCKLPVQLSRVPESLVVVPARGRGGYSSRRSRTDDDLVDVVLDGNIMGCIVGELCAKNRCCKGLLSFCNVSGSFTSAVSHTIRKLHFGFWCLVLVTEVMWGLRSDSERISRFIVPDSLKECVANMKEIKYSCFGKIDYQTVQGPTNVLPYTSHEKTKLSEDFIAILNDRMSAALHYGDGTMDAAIDYLFVFPTDDKEGEFFVTKILAVDAKTSRTGSTSLGAVITKIRDDAVALARQCNRIRRKKVKVIIDWFILTDQNVPVGVPNCYNGDGLFVPPFTTLLFTPTPT